MGRSPFDELGDRLRALQEGAGENLGRLRQAAEAMAANLDPKKRGHQRELVGAQRKGLEHLNQSQQGSSGRTAESRRGEVKGLQKPHPIANVSHTERVVREVGSSELLQKKVPVSRREMQLPAATLLVEEAPVAEASGSAAVHAREDLGRSTWTLLHMLAAQYPEQPTKQQQKDVKSLMDLMTRIYPCKLCADHFKVVLKAHPVQADSGFELAQWMCQVHNVVNRSLNKPLFPCQRVDARWGALNCDEDACSLEDRSIK